MNRVKQALRNNHINACMACKCRNAGTVVVIFGAWGSDRD